MSTELGGMWIVSESIKFAQPKISEDVLKHLLRDYKHMMSHYFQFESHTTFKEQVAIVQSFLSKLEEDSEAVDFLEVIALVSLMLQAKRRKEK